MRTWKLEDKELFYVEFFGPNVICGIQMPSVSWKGLILGYVSSYS
jgi:hypothetical protein